MSWLKRLFCDHAWRRGGSSYDSTDCDTVNDEEPGGISSLD